MEFFDTTTRARGRRTSRARTRARESLKTRKALQQRGFAGFLHPKMLTVRDATIVLIFYAKGE